MNIKNNQRFKDTEKNIQQTLLDLAKTTEIRKVSVRTICEKAGINRSTFYAHYLDINDLVDKIGREMMMDIADMFRDSDNILEFFLSPEGLTQMITYVKDHRDFFDIYLNQYHAEASESFSLLWEDAGKPYIQHFGITDDAEMWYHFTFFKAGFLAVLSQWLKMGCKEAPEELAAIILRNLPQEFDRGIR